MPNLNKPFIVYGRPGCDYCDKAVALIGSLDGWMHYYCTLDWKRKEQLTRQGLTTVPQIWHDGIHVGGFDDLERYLQDA